MLVYRLVYSATVVEAWGRRPRACRRRSPTGSTGRGRRDSLLTKKPTDGSRPAGRQASYDEEAAPAPAPACCDAVGRACCREATGSFHLSIFPSTSTARRTLKADAPGSTALATPWESRPVSGCGEKWERPTARSDRPERLLLTSVDICLYTRGHGQALPCTRLWAGWLLVSAAGTASQRTAVQAGHWQRTGTGPAPGGLRRETRASHPERRRPAVDPLRSPRQDDGSVAGMDGCGRHRELQGAWLSALAGRERERDSTGFHRPGRKLLGGSGTPLPFVSLSSVGGAFLERRSDGATERRPSIGRPESDLPSTNEAVRFPDRACRQLANQQQAGRESRARNPVEERNSESERTRQRPRRLHRRLAKLRQDDVNGSPWRVAGATQRTRGDENSCRASGATWRRPSL
ncbi:hypothetical protein VTN02DRAFT_785 [Thermoascus thermophilus]